MNTGIKVGELSEYLKKLSIIVKILNRKTKINNLFKWKQIN